MAAASIVAPFGVAKHLEASEPPEARGLRRDDVRLLVSRVDSDSIAHSRFSELPRWLAPGDLLVVNTSGTLNAALEATTAEGETLAVHISTRLPGNFWVVEVRRPGPVASLPYRHARPGSTLALPGRGRVTLLAPYPFHSEGLRPSDSRTRSLAGLHDPRADRVGSLACSFATPSLANETSSSAMNAQSRLWMAALELPEPVVPYLERFGTPIRYNYVTRPWPSSMYQTIFAREPGSAEMPSAARPFTPELITRLVSSGIQIAPLLLHTGVASLEDHEPPYEEFFRVSPETADCVNAARVAGHRVIAVGTTVVRALETVTDRRGVVHPGEGWTDLVITPERELRSVNGLITGFHEPHATHLAMIEQVIAAAGCHHPSSHLERAYDEAQRAAYLWHEFGDSHLIIG
ncbi:MAG TPA: S-adenosylmethionine:tRNA ribosyltransferase-isomerase [Vicinamibacterales bacterium]|nr:S-adenosylmethionine:tRNA ribosyltransferase-isomerase [Vicinamibacterales bacterium]